MTGMIAEILLDGVRSGVFREDLEIELDARFVRGSISAIQESIAAGGDPRILPLQRRRQFSEHSKSGD